MSALRRRLNRVLLVLLGGLALQWFVADRTIVAVVEGEMESRLRHDADSLLASLELDANGQVHCDPRSPGTIYARALRPLLARLAGDAPTAATFDPHEELPTLVRLLGRIHGDKPLAIQWTAPEGSLPFDRQDLLALIGNLADNACKWARAQVRIEIRERDGIDVVVSDDGPGCQAGDLESLGVRGQRVDESVPGYGLGLAIARGIAEFAGGRLQFDRSATLGGLEVTAHLPARRA